MMKAAGGSAGPDRVTRNSYDNVGRVIRVETAVGTAAASDEVITAYTANGRVDHVRDGENNRTTYIYDGHDRLSQTRYPVTTKGANASNTGDYEQLSYDARGSVVQRRLRDGNVIGYSYDDLGRMTAKDSPNLAYHDWDVTYSYDLLGRPLSAIGNGWSPGFWTYDALGRLLTERGFFNTFSYNYDAAGRRTRITHPDGFYVNYDYDVTGNVTTIRENGATSGVGVLASYAYDAVGRRSGVTFGNGSVQSFTYDAASRLASLTNNLGGAATAHDLAQTFTYNPAGQIASVTRSNDGYGWQAHFNTDPAYVTDGLNRIMSAGAVSYGHDARGNVTSDSINAYLYTAENRLAQQTAGTNVILSHEPGTGLMFEAATSSVKTWFGWSGTEMLIEGDGYNGGALVRRYVHGPGIDNPIVWYEGSGTSDRRFLMADERGSIVSVTDSAGATIAINAYDEYGIPAPTNSGRFGYTGQIWLPDLNLWYYKARMYSPTRGRFLQTDPIGYADGMNWYDYVGGDPVNFVDPLGLAQECNQKGQRASR